MKWLLWFHLLLIYQPVTASVENVESCISQPNKIIWRKPGQNVVLTCTISSDCSGKSWNYRWFHFKGNFHFPLKLLDNYKYQLEGASLHISALHTNDSGIYYCAAVSPGHPAHGLQHVALGTPLVVRENVKIMVRTILLLSLILLSIYSLAVVTLIVKKHGCRRFHKFENNSSKKKQFHDVLQEMHRRRNQEGTKQTAPSTDLTISSDDIYQNV